MSSRCSSAPKMNRVYTPRVKNGNYNNDSPPKGNLYHTTPKFQQNYLTQNIVHNPQFNHEQQKNHKIIDNAQIAAIVDKKVNLNQKSQQIPAKPQSAKIFKPNQKSKQPVNKGREIQYIPQKKQNIPQPKMQINSNQLLKKSQSLNLSRHFPDNTIKSTSIKKQRAQFDQKFKIAFGYLLDQNQQYIKERRRACNQKARPKQEIFRVMRPAINTTNKDQFYLKGTPYAQSMHPRAQMFAASFGEGKVCGNSTNNQIHSGKQGPRADLASWPQGFKLQGPTYEVTTYNNSFPNHGQFQKMVPIATFNQHPLGMPHRTNSTHRTFYKGQYTKKADIASWNNLHPYGNEFNPDRSTTYKQKHGSKQKQPIQQWPMYDPQLIKSDGKFSTQYKDNLLNPTRHELNNANYCQCGRKSHRH